MAIVLPVYNEAELIERSVLAVADVARRYEGRAVIVAVDDASSDDSGAILDELAGRVEELDVQHCPVNGGYGSALRAGARRAADLGLEYVTFMDSDLTNPPEDLLKIGRLAAERHPYIKASRFVPGGRMEGVPWRRRVFSHGGNLVAGRLFGSRVADVTNGFRAVRTDLVCGWPLQETGFAVIMEELDWALRSGIDPVEFPTVLSSRTADQRGSSFAYTPRVIAAYLRYPLRALRRRARPGPGGRE
jgi:dolichol-phosphate mannosyltransferase